MGGLTISSYSCPIKLILKKDSVSQKLESSLGMVLCRGRFVSLTSFNYKEVKKNENGDRLIAQVKTEQGDPVVKNTGTTTGKKP